MACCKRSFANCVPTCKPALSYARTYQYMHTYLHQLDYVFPKRLSGLLAAELYPMELLELSQLAISILAYLSTYHCYSCGNRIITYTYMSCQLKPVLRGRQLVNRRRMVVWTRAIMSKRPFGHQIQEMNFPVARQLILIERSNSPFEWLVVTFVWTGTGLAPYWLRTKALYLPYLTPRTP